MANPDSERHPRNNNGGSRIGGRSYAVLLILLAGLMLAFALFDVELVVWGQVEWSFYTVSAVAAIAALAVLCGYLLYHFNRKRPIAVGQDFNF